MDDSDDLHVPQPLFFCDVSDAALKDVMQQMEHPIYSLSKSPDTAIRMYYAANGEDWLEVTPSVKGIATIYDKDILIYCISQVMGAVRRGQPYSRRLSVSPREMLLFMRRGVGGRDYQALMDALDRLQGTRLKTSIKTGATSQVEGFGLIDGVRVERANGHDGRIIRLEIRLSNWLFNAIEHKEVLTLHPDYFRLRKPLERRLYELARKHCGQKHSWSITLENLYRKSGSTSLLKRFRQHVRDIQAENNLPDYMVQFDPDADKVIFVSRGSVPPTLPVIEDIFIPVLDSDVYELARELAPGWDIRMIEAEWRSWATETPSNPEQAFLGFCRRWYERRGPP